MERKKMAQILEFTGHPMEPDEDDGSILIEIMGERIRVTPQFEEITSTGPAEVISIDGR